MSPRPVSKAARTDLRNAIKASAWKGIAENGASSLSLRAIARDLGITAPAIYNYFADRDALVTELIIEAYTSFGDWQLAARDAAASKSLPKKLEDIGMAYRAWALAFPERYQLIFGAPISGYRTDHEAIRPAGSRSLTALVGTIEEIRAAGRLVAEGFPAVQESHAQDFAAWTQRSGFHPQSLAVGILIWARVHGLVSLEISGNLIPFGPAGDGLYRYELRSLTRQFLKPMPQHATRKSAPGAKGQAS